MEGKGYLLIVESPGKIKKIQSFLPKGYLVTASVGHIRDLDRKTLSVDVENNFAPKYVILSDKKKVVSELRKLSDGRVVLLAQDADREGEGIAVAVKEVLAPKAYQRIAFNEITKEAVLAAIKKPRAIDKDLAMAQQTRRILDRLVGYKVSPFLNRVDGLSDGTWLAAGRVQSVIVRLLVDHEAKVAEFFAKDHGSHYECSGAFKVDGQPLACVLHYQGDKMEVADYADAVKLVKILAECTWTVDGVETKPSYRDPTAPFTTSTLQQAASSKLGFPVQRTMQVAQKLYEAGHITYMRTDCPTLSDDAHKQIKEHVIGSFGDKYYRHKQYASKAKNAQEAHEAIRPTKIAVTEVESMDADARRLYQLIWKKTVSSQMARAVFDVTKVSVKPTRATKVLSYRMIGSVSRLVFDGFLRVYQDGEDGETGVEIKVAEGAKAALEELRAREVVKHPPTRFTEATLVQKLEQLGIGRPSTYASMIAKIQDHRYAKVDNTPGQERKLKEVTYDTKTGKLHEKVTVVQLGKENKRLVPTELGTKVTNFLVQHFPQIMDYKFTADMEGSLDDIASGKLVWHDVLRDFNKTLDDQIAAYADKHPLAKKAGGGAGKSSVLLGNHPVTGKPIYFMTTKYGPAIKMEKDGKDVFVSVKEKPTLEQAASLMENKKSNTLIREIGPYQIKNGQYGPYIQVKVGKGVKFYSIGKRDPQALTKADCDLICATKKKK
jgi:DNA topoisomerase I